MSQLFYSSEDDSGSNPFDYARITDVDYKAVVVDEPNSKGKVIITERLTFDIHAASKDNLFWELWRELPEDYIDGLKVEYKVNSVKQILKDGSEVIYQKSPKLYWNDSDYTSDSKKYGPGKWYHSKGPYNESARQYECVLFYVDGLYREEVVFEIEYEMFNAAFRYNDCSELYLSLYSGETIKHLKSFTGQILFPLKNMPRSVNYEAHTYGTNSHIFPFVESTTINPGYHTFLFELDESQLKFKPYNQYIEFLLISSGSDKHIFTKYAPSNKYSDEDVLSELREEQEKYQAIPEKAKKTKTTILIISSVATLLIIIYSYNTDKRMKKKHTFYEASMKMDYFRDIPSNLDPNFAATLVFCRGRKLKDNEDGYSAIMLSLVRKDYIELSKIDNLKDWTFNNVKIIIKHNPTQLIQVSSDSYNVERENLEPLTMSEKYYFNLIVRHAVKNEISVKDFQAKVSTDYENTNSFVRNIKNSITNIGTTEGYFQKANYQQPQQSLKSLSLTFTILGIISIILCNIIIYHTTLDLAFGSFFILGFGLIGSAIYINKLSNKYILLTQFGEDEYAKWRGLYNFLNSETLMNERTIIELPIWEQYLVYATAFGISDKVIKALNIRCPNIDMSPMLSNPYYRSTNFYSSCRSFRTATRTASYIAHSGGYSGGSWRIRWRWPWRRWRPEEVTKF